MYISKKLIFMSMLMLLSGCGLNNIPIYEEEANAAWSQVLNQYQRRTDLVPNLVATVKGAAIHEKEVLTAVTEARAKVGSINITSDMVNDPEAMKKFAIAQRDLGSALSRLLVTIESYPAITGNQNFLALQSELEGTENRIAVARRDFIYAVQRYNTELKVIPGRWWRSLMYPDAAPKSNFDVSDAVKSSGAPRVDFK